MSYNSVTKLGNVNSFLELNNVFQQTLTPGVQCTESLYFRTILSYLSIKILCTKSDYLHEQLATTSQWILATPLNSAHF